MFSIVSKSAVGSLWGRRKKITSRAWKRLVPTLVFERLISVKSFKTPNPNVYKFETYPQMVILPEAYGKSLVCIAVGYGTARKSKPRAGSYLSSCRGGSFDSGDPERHDESRVLLHREEGDFCFHPLM